MGLAVCVFRVCQDETMNVRGVVDRLESVFPTRCLFICPRDLAAAPLRKFEGALAYSGPHTPSVQLAVDELAFACAYSGSKLLGYFSHFT